MIVCPFTKMTTKDMFEPRILHGTGKRVIALLTQDGCIYPVIAHDAKNDRKRFTSAPQYGARILRGERPMHQTTLLLAKPPWDADYTTTNKQYHGGSQKLEPEPRPQKAPSMHRSQFQLGHYDRVDTYPGYPAHEAQDQNVCQTHYEQTYYPKEIIPANRLHLTSYVNRINQMEGANTKEAVKHAADQPMNYFTQYKRTHMLGFLRDPRIELEHPVREQYNIITGESMGLAWKSENPRKSGNRVLHGLRSALPPHAIQ